MSSCLKDMVVLGGLSGYLHPARVHLRNHHPRKAQRFPMKGGRAGIIRHMPLAPFLREGAGPVWSISLVTATQPDLLVLINHSLGTKLEQPLGTSKGVTLHPGRPGIISWGHPAWASYWLSLSEAPVPTGTIPFTRGDHEGYRRLEKLGGSLAVKMTTD